MKTTIRRQSVRNAHGLRAARRPLLIARAAVLVGALGLAPSGCNRSEGDAPGAPLPTESAMAGDATGSLFLSLGKSFLLGSANQTGSTLTGWALGQLGIASTDPTGEALSEIASTLRDIDEHLRGIAQEISALISVQVVANCQQLSANLTADLGRIHTVLQEYDTIVCTGDGSCANGAPPSNVTMTRLMAFSDLALDTQGGGQMSLDAILDRINQALVGATQGGIIAACIHPNIPSCTPPVPGTFNDAEYYTRVQPVASFYYYYQTVAALLYCEAMRFQAYVTAGAPDAETLDPDEMKDFLLGSTDPDVVFLLNKTANRIQTTWNNLRNQFNLVGAPYTNDHLLLRNSTADPVLYVLDLDDFTLATDEPCADLTTDNPGCSSPIRGGPELSSVPIEDVAYAGQTGKWRFATLTELTYMMEGWDGGQAWEYLARDDGTTTRGFRNMKDKVLISDEVRSATMRLTWNTFWYDVTTDWTFDYVPFIDGAIPYDAPGLNHHLPVDTSAAIQSTIGTTMHVGPTWYEARMYTVGLTPHRYTDCYGVYKYNAGTGFMDWSYTPGWYKSPFTSPMAAFHLPVIDVSGITPKPGLRFHNAAGVPTMCTEDYEAWFAEVVPPPQFQ